MKIESLVVEDWESVKEIYQQGIDSGLATFEQETPNWHNWHEKHLPYARLVVKNGQEVVGWAALTPYSNREVYKGVAEISIYILNGYQGTGIGSILLSNLIIESEKHGIWTLQASIFPQNHASLSLHKKHGFRQVGIREKIAKHVDGWRDVMLLERRKKDK